MWCGWTSPHRAVTNRLGAVRPWFCPRAYNDKVGLAIVCPITGQKKGYPFEVDIPDGHSVAGVILADQVKSLDWRARNGQKRGSLPHQVVSSTLHLLGKLLDENAPP